VWWDLQYDHFITNLLQSATAKDFLKLATFWRSINSWNSVAYFFASPCIFGIFFTQTCTSPVSMVQSRPRPSHWRRSSAELTVGRQGRWLCPHPVIRQPAVSSSMHGTRRRQSLSATAQNKVSAAAVDYDAQCRFLTELRPRVSGSSHRADPITTSVNAHNFNSKQTVSK